MTAGHPLVCFLRLIWKRTLRNIEKTLNVRKLGANIDSIPTLISIGVENLPLAHHQTTGCSLSVYVYTSSNALVMAEQLQCLINKFFKPTSPDSGTSNCTGVQQLLPNPMLESDADKNATSATNDQALELRAVEGCH